jgi:catechol 2,3-dioxygenase-like lactoylglutathione lyase family enzyme
MKTGIFPRMHVSLYVSNLEKSIAFYTSFFGLEPAKIKPGYAKYVLDSPSLIISFIENAERVQQNFGHLGFQVETEEELNLRLWAAKNKGLVQKEETGTACCYAKLDKFWVNDPDGVQWEVYYFHEDVEFNDPRYENAGIEACCSPAMQVNADASEKKADVCC